MTERGIDMIKISVIHFSFLVYRVDMVDVALEMEKWAKWAALACVASSAHCFISSATSTLSTVLNRYLVCDLLKLTLFYCSNLALE